MKLALFGMHSRFLEIPFERIKMPVFKPFFCVPCILVCSGTTLRADWQDEIGFTRLQALVSAELPSAPSDGLTQVEAFEPEGLEPNINYNYIPNTAASEFTGKTFDPRSGASATSSHANHVALNFYGNTSQLPGACDVDLYSADDWLGSGFLGNGSNEIPLFEDRAVQSHSWIGSGGAETGQRLDYAINRDGFVCVVGVNNGYSTTLPDLLCQSYHVISVGRDDGQHSAGTTTIDGQNRIKPEIVAPSASPEYATSWTTPMVAGTAGLIVEKLSSSPYSLSGADKPRVTKAILLASATKNTVASWSNTDTEPLDLVYGAGELNAYHAYSTVRSGRAYASDSNQYGIRAWAADSVNTTENTYYFTIPTGAPSTPFSATLVWHRNITTQLTGGFFNKTRTWSSTLANLNLRLHHATGTTLGSIMSESVSAVDNVELIYQSALAPGDYALRVENTSNTDTPYALAWHSLPAVTVAVTVSTAREIDGQAGVITLTRTGDTTLPLYVPLTTGGTAIAGTHYQILPDNVTIQASQTSTTLQVSPISDNLAQGERTVTVTVATDFALVSNPSESGIVTLEDKPFDQWRFNYFTSPELANPSVSNETADPDDDQLANLIEYALDLDPKSPDISPIAMIDSGGYLALSADDNPDATDITWAAETTGDLENWNPAIVTSPTNPFTARDTVLIDSAEKRFIRLKITRP